MGCFYRDFQKTMPAGLRRWQQATLQRCNTSTLFVLHRISRLYLFESIRFRHPSRVNIEILRLSITFIKRYSYFSENGGYLFNSFFPLGPESRHPGLLPPEENPVPPEFPPLEEVPPRTPRISRRRRFRACSRTTLPRGRAREPRGEVAKLQALLRMDRDPPPPRDESDDRTGSSRRTLFQVISRLARNAV